MRLHHYLCLVLPLAATIIVSSCKKQDTPQPTPTGTTDQSTAATEDTLKRLEGEWSCNGQNSAAHVQFTSATTWIALDTDLVVSDRTVRISMPHCDTLVVKTDGYNEYMTYTDVGDTYIRCNKHSDANTIYFVDNRYDCYYGYGGGSRLTYYIAQDSLVFSSDYHNSYNRYNMSLTGKRK